MTLKRRSFVFICCLAFGINTSLLVAAKPAKTKRQIKTKSRDLEKVTAEMRKKQLEQKKLKAEAAKISKKLRKKEGQIDVFEKSLLFTRKKNRDVKQNLAEEKNKFDQLIEDVTKTEYGLEQALHTYYVSAKLYGPQSNIPVYSKQLIQSQIQLLREQKNQQDSSQGKLNKLTETYQIIQQEVETQEDQIRGLRSDVKKQSRRLKKTQTRSEIVSGELRNLRQTASELASLIDILRSRARKEKAEEKKARLEKMASGHSPIPKYSLSWPVQGKVVRRFGRQKHPELGTPYISNGILIQRNKTQPVNVVSDGVVLYAGDFMSYGPMILVEHPGDWYSVYGQMDKWIVEKGQELKKGDIVGWTGMSKKGQYQAYFELRFYGKPTNPIPWLAKRSLSQSK